VTWISPLGLPIVQPYKKERSFTVVTAFQNLNLAVDYDDLPVQKRKQRTALPPNFVHSLDATHMLITCRKMMEKKLVFASVHDSYWTHPCDIDEMNEVLRDAFVELYEKPLLENFRDSLVRRYPHITFPEVPMRGNLDLQSVKKSTYFFH